jgi:hypothetical protein
VAGDRHDQIAQLSTIGALAKDMQPVANLGFL